MGKSGPRCSICQHEKRVSIELGIVHGISAPVLAQRFGCSKFSIIRHARAHLSPAQKAALLSATTAERHRLTGLAGIGERRVVARFGGPASATASVCGGVGRLWRY